MLADVFTPPLFRWSKNLTGGLYIAAPWVSVKEHPGRHRLKIVRRKGLRGGAKSPTLWFLVAVNPAEEGTYTDKPAFAVPFPTVTKAKAAAIALVHQGKITPE